MQCISVDFPDPDGPMTAVKRPRSKVTLTPASACTVACPVPYVLRRSMARAAGVGATVSGAAGSVSATMPHSSCRGENFSMSSASVTIGSGGPIPKRFLT